MGKTRVDTGDGYTYRIKIANKTCNSPTVYVWCYEGEYESMPFLRRLFASSMSYSLQATYTEEIEKTITKAKRGARNKWKNKKAHTNALE